jgi:copper chaperone CopZ
MTSSCVNCTCTTCECSKAKSVPFAPDRTQIQVILKKGTNDKIVLKAIANELYVAFPLLIRCIPVLETHLVLNLNQSVDQALLIPKIRATLVKCGFDENRVILIEGREDESPSHPKGEIQTTTLKLEGLVCSNCTQAVDRILSMSAGVVSSGVTLVKAVIRHDRSSDLNNIVKRLEGAGFTANLESDEVSRAYLIFSASTSKSTRDDHCS